MKRIATYYLGWLIMAACSLIPLSLQAQDQTVNGNLTVTGTIDSAGNTLSLGTRTDTTTYPGWEILYTDGTTSTLEFDASRAANLWKWQQAASTTLQLQMTLDNSNVLTLYDQSSTPVAKITLNPLGTSTFANSLTLNGTDNEMPNQTLVGANSVLTEGLADGRYLLSSATSLSLFTGASSTGTDAIALGDYTMASGANAFAIGYGSTASGQYSTAMGNSTSAQSFGSVAMGQFNVGGFATGGDTSWIATDPLLELGNGISGAPSDALVVYKNGNATLQGNATINGADNEMPNQTLVGANSVLTEGLADGRYLSIGGTSLALFIGAAATGTDAMALGDYTTASGANAFANGFYSTASGNHSAAFNDTTLAGAYDSFVIGANNVGGGDPVNWVLTDPLFEIGNGVTGNGSGNNSYNSTPSDALVVYKNGNTTINGADNEMPNQTLVGSNSVLTKGLADSLYLRIGGTSGGATSFTLFGGSATGTDSIALGADTTASGQYSTAMGNTTTSQSFGSVAMGQFNVGGFATGGDTSWIATDPLLELGNGTDSGHLSDALIVYKNGNATLQGNATINGTDNEMPNQTYQGPNSVVTIAMGDGRYAFADSGSGSTIVSGPNGTTMMGFGTATGTGSTAMGYGTANGFSSLAGGYSVADGNYSTSLGYGSTSPSYAELVIGQFNVGGFATGGDTTWIGTDPLLELGNGVDASHLSDALVVYKNGNTTIKGVDNEMPNQTLVGPNSVMTESLADSRYVSSSSITIGSGTDNTSDYALGTGPTTGVSGGIATGAYSFASGDNSIASGSGSMALGGSLASGVLSNAMGPWATASGTLSTAIGWASTASADTSFAFAAGNAIGVNSMSLGGDASGAGSISIKGNASGVFSTAIGDSATASGVGSTAIGEGAYALGAANTGVTASGDFSTAMGVSTTAQAYNSIVMGRNNVGGGDPNNWVSTDPIFEIGNGGQVPSWVQTPWGQWVQNIGYWDWFTSPPQWFPPVPAPHSDALVVYKNGNTTINGNDNEMPHQALTGANSVLTEGLADGRYLSIGGTSGATSFTLFTDSSATGADAVALGDVDTASGINAFAVGYGSTASGQYSAAMGNTTTAQSFGSVAMGQFNVGGLATGGDTSWIATDPLFELGNGTDAGHPSDALVVYKNGNITLNGADNEMPNQALQGPNSLLTEGLADARYALIGSSGGSDTTIVSGPNGSTTMGFGTASGTGSTAMGYATASGFGSAAMGYSTASGDYSTTMGNYSTASGQSSTAMGEYATATGEASLAIGNATTAQSFGSVAMGQFNVGGFATGGDTTWIGTDPLLELGNGVDSSHLSDALIVYKNGNISLNGADNEMPNQTLTGANSVLTEGLADGRYVTQNSLNSMGLVTQGALYSDVQSMGLVTQVQLGEYVSWFGGQLNQRYVQSNANTNYSVAMGQSSVASGYASTAMGNSTTAQSFGSVAMGQFNVGGFATGGDTSWIATDPLLEVGDGTSGAPSDALIVYKNGNITLNGADNEMPNQTLVGANSVLTEGLADSRYLSTGGTSFTMFTGAAATGTDSIALGDYTLATGAHALASGYSTTASGNFSTVMGNTTTAQAVNSVAMGTFNIGGGDSSNWVSTDPLFEIGNGGDGNGNGNPSASAPSDALIVYKNGNVAAQGVITAAAGGDIPMFTGN